VPIEISTTIAPPLWRWAFLGAGRIAAWISSPNPAHPSLSPRHSGGAFSLAGRMGSMRFSLKSLLIVLALGPIALWLIWGWEAMPILMSGLVYSVIFLPFLWHIIQHEKA
jgi:hypothetical protein